MYYHLIFVLFLAVILTCDIVEYVNQAVATGAFNRAMCNVSHIYDYACPYTYTSMRLLVYVRTYTHRKPHTASSIVYTHMTSSVRAPTR